MGLDLAVDLGIQFIDLDQEIEKATKQSIQALFKEHGEAHFRQLEKLHLEQVVSELDAFVMATGGGTPCFFNNLFTMKKNGTTIHINTPLQAIKDRLSQDTSRPLLQSNALEDLWEKRRTWYSQADHTIQEYKEMIALFH